MGCFRKLCLLFCVVVLCCTCVFNASAKLDECNDIAVSVSAFVDSSPVLPGDTISYAITIVNQGNVDVQDIRIIDCLSDSLSVFDISDGGVISDNILSWSGMSLRAGDSTSLLFSAVAESPGIIDNDCAVYDGDNIVGSDVVRIFVEGDSGIMLLSDNVITSFTWPEEFMSVLQWDAMSSKWVIPAGTFGFDENNQLPSYALGFMGWFPTSLITNDGTSVPLTWDFNGLPGMLYEGAYTLSPTLADGYELAEGVDCSIELRFSDSVSEDFVHEVLPRHVVQGLTPKGCRMNIYNYTASGIPEGANGWPSNPYGVAGGIGYKHLLAFNSPANWGDWNMYTNSASPVTDIVQPVLRDGFPVLNLGSKTDFGGYSGYVNGANSELKTEWLEYLLSRNEAYGKTVYADVTGLFQKDEDGYYYYDSSKNYAVMGEDGHSIVLYDSPGGGHAPSNNYGQFFPFNPPEQVFNAENQNISENNIWPLTYTGADAVSSGNGSFYNVQVHESDMDYFMGMGLDVGFMQPVGGIVSDTGDPMEFTFSGDDDVWLFIDDVLVADLGGVHDKGVFSVNFQTGEVVVNDGYFDKSGNSLTTRHTLKSAFERAGLYDSNDFNGDTFADDTAHRIRFFYMERGAGASNLSLRFNVIEPDTGNIKITKSIQEGEDVNQVFNFEMRLDDHGVNGPRGDLMFNGGVAEFQMSPGDELIVSDLLAGMHYEIVETDSGGYIPVMENAEGEIIFDQTIDVSCYNKLKDSSIELPTTGGHGIILFVVLGLWCMLVGLFVLCRKVV